MLTTHRSVSKGASTDSNSISVQVWLKLREAFTQRRTADALRIVIDMAAKEMAASAPGFTFVSINGPTLDKVHAKAMRAHTTRVNFARRRRRLVLDYSDQKESLARVHALRVEQDGLNTDRDLTVHSRLPILSHPGLDRKLNRKDAFFIQNCALERSQFHLSRCSRLTFHPHIVTQAMQKLYLVADIPESDTAFAPTHSDWARYLRDPTMLDVSLYFARHVYAARQQNQSVQLIVDTYKGKAIRSVRERLNCGSDGVTDSLVAAIITLVIIDVRPSRIKKTPSYVSISCFRIISDDMISNSKF